MNSMSMYTRGMYTLTSSKIPMDVNRCCGTYAVAKEGTHVALSIAALNVMVSITSPRASSDMSMNLRQTARLKVVV